MATISSLRIKNDWRKWLEAKSREVGQRDRVLSFAEFINTVKPAYQWSEMARRLVAVLQRVADGELTRVMVFMPPRHGKSELVSRLFSAYCLYRDPASWVGISSYSADLAFTLSRAARDNFQAIGGEIREDAGAVKHWETPEGGGMWAAGVGGPITGKGIGNPATKAGGVAIIDDPLKNHIEAFSETIRERQKDWWRSTLYTRLEEDSPVVVLQTRWHEDDVSGWLLSNEAEEPEHWHVVSLEGVKEDSLPEIPTTCTLEPDWRSPGEPLCPERVSLKRLLKLMGSVGAYFWGALYQQRPSPLEGNFFKRSDWQRYKELPRKEDRLAKFEYVCLSFDCAFKETHDSDFVVGLCIGKLGADFYVLDCVRDRTDINGTLHMVKDLAAKWPQARAKLVEDKANGSAVIDLLKRKVPGLIPVNPEGGKIARATAVSPYVESHNVWLPEGAAWVSDFIEECAAFPNGANDDQVDAFTQGINWLETNARRYGKAKKSGLKLY